MRLRSFLGDSITELIGPKRSHDENRKKKALDEFWAGRKGKTIELLKKALPVMSLDEKVWSTAKTLCPEFIAGLLDKAANLRSASSLDKPTPLLIAGPWLLKVLSWNVVSSFDADGKPVTFRKRRWYSDKWETCRVDLGVQTQRLQRKVMVGVLSVSFAFLVFGLYQD